MKVGGKTCFPAHCRYHFSLAAGARAGIHVAATGLGWHGSRRTGNQHQGNEEGDNRLGDFRHENTSLLNWSKSGDQGELTYLCEVG